MSHLSGGVGKACFIWGTCSTFLIGGEMWSLGEWDGRDGISVPSHHEESTF